MKKQDYEILYVDFDVDPNDPAMLFAQAAFQLTEPFWLTWLCSCLRIKPHHSTVAAPKAVSKLLALARLRPLLVILKEPQLLASPEHSTLAAMLRSFLHNQSMSSPMPIKTLFIGSDEHLMKQLFNQYDEPFYLSAHVQSLAVMAEGC